MSTSRSSDQIDGDVIHYELHLFHHWIHNTITIDC